MKRYGFLQFLFRTRRFIDEGFSLIAENTRSVKEILNNHLPHLHAEVTEVKGTVNEVKETVDKIAQKLDV